MDDEHKGSAEQQQSQERTQEAGEHGQMRGGNRHIRVEYEYGPFKFKAEGAHNDVADHAAVFHRTINQAEMVDGKALAIESKDAPMLRAGSDSASSTATSTSTEQTVPVDLRQFYRSKSPKHQWQEILVITYYYHRNGQEEVTLADFTEAYNELRRIPVTPPARLPQSIQKVKERHSDYFFSPSSGKYALTDAGRAYVEDLGAVEEDSDSQPRLL